MLSLKVVEEIKRLLDEKALSQRSIAITLGVSRGTVQAIASGKRGIHGHEQAAEAESEDLTPVRCPGCGARVYVPCVLCEARAFKHRALSKSQLRPSPKQVA